MSRELIRCTLPEGVTEAEFGVPLPGTRDAVELGCTCPEDGSDDWPRRLTFATDCQLHELQKRTN